MAKNKGKHRSQKPKDVPPAEKLKSWTHHAVDFVRPHAVKLISVAIGLVIVFAGFSVWSYIERKKEAGATREFGQVIEAANRPVEGEIDAMAMLRGEQPDPNAKKYKSFAERAQAALAEVAALQSKYAGTDVGTQTLLLQAALDYDLGKHDEAIAAYKKYLQKGPKLPQLQELAREGLGYAWEAKALAEKDESARNSALHSAMQAYQDIETDEKGPYLATALYHQGRVMALLGDAKGAIALYKKALEKAPSMQLREQINERLGALQAANPEPAAPASQPASRPAKP